MLCLAIDIYVKYQQRVSFIWNEIDYFEAKTTPVDGQTSLARRNTAGDGNIATWWAYSSPRAEWCTYMWNSELVKNICNENDIEHGEWWSASSEPILNTMSCTLELVRGASLFVSGIVHLIRFRSVWTSPTVNRPSHGYSLLLTYALAWECYRQD